MAKYHTQGNKQHHKKISKPKPKVEQTGNQAELAGQSELPDMASSGAIQAQVERLGDPRLQTTQRQALAAQIGRVQGNGHLQQVMLTLNTPPLQRHSIPEGRRGVGDEEDEIQTKREDHILQRHSIPEGRRGIGDEEDEIQTKRMIQRSPAFGRMATGQRRSSQSRSLWGNGVTATVQRKNGKTKAAPKGADPKAAPAAKKGLKGEDPAVKQAEKEYPKFVAGGPYKFNNYVPDTQDNFGKFDTVYDPAKKLLTANMRVKFQFPDLPVPKGNSITDVAMKPIIQSIHNLYITTFIKHVTTGWSGKFNFRNVREPHSVWGKLNPIQVKVNVKPVQSNQHYIFNKYYTPQIDPATGGGKIPNVQSNVGGQVHMYLFNTKTRGFTGDPNVGKGEIARLKNNLPKIRFANHSTGIDAKYIPDLQFLGDYLRRMNRPKFNINVVGHANKTGKEPDNVHFSKLRAQVVMDKLKAFGVTNHKLTASGVGSTGATKDGSWRKVDFALSVDKSFSNVQDVDMHEFGHMLGLDDEYDRGDARTHTTQHKMKMMQKMLGDKLYGKGKEDKYADEVAKIYKKELSAGVMHGGDEVRVYNYVTFWQALYDTAAKGANQPTPAFTWQDWKVTG